MKNGILLKIIWTIGKKKKSLIDYSVFLLKIRKNEVFYHKQKETEKVTVTVFVHVLSHFWKRVATFGKELQLLEVD